MEKRLVLASGSPRRRDLLENIGLEFSVSAASIPEPLLDGMEPSIQVRTLALAKARAVAGQLDDAVVLGADTVVVLDGQILGKPVDCSGARSMLKFLQGREHLVYTGVALVDVSSGKETTEYEETRVRFRPLDKHEIEWYVATGEPMDKAGAYGAQGLGSVLIESINGCYFNVVGLPVARVVGMLRSFGIDLFVDRQDACGR